MNHLACILILAGIVLFTVAGVIALPGGRLFSESARYWKTNCDVVSCTPAYPSHDLVSFQSHEHFQYNGSKIIKNGCEKHPVGSLLVCYVKSNSLVLNSGATAGLVLVILSGVFATASLVSLLIGGLLMCCRHRCKTKVKHGHTILHSSTQHSANATGVKEDQ